jgi:hypothetical protein
VLAQTSGFGIGLKKLLMELSTKDLLKTEVRLLVHPYLVPRAFVV